MTDVHINEKDGAEIMRFAERLKEEVLKRCGEDEGLEIITREVVKFNDRVLHAMIFKTDDPAAPTLYAEDLYKHYSKGYSLPYLAGEVMRTIRSAHSIRPDAADCGFDIEDIRGRTALRLADMNRNSRFLSSIPYREVGNGLALICTVVNDSTGEWRVTLTHDLLQEMEIEEWEVFSDAIRNAYLTDPPRLVVFPLENPGINLLEFCAEPDEDGAGVYMLTTERGMSGSAALYYPGMQSRIAAATGGSYYVLPCSVHELLIISERGEVSVEKMLDMVHTANREILSPEDVLTDNIFYFNANKGTLETINNEMEERERLVS